MKSRIRLTRALPIASAAFLVLSVISSSSALAGFVITVQSVSAVQGSTNDTLDVFLTNTGTAPVTIGGFSFEITASSGISFTSVDTSTLTPYIFAGYSGFGPDISNQPPNLPGNTLEAEDFYATPGAGISLGVGPANSVGLGHVHFNVSPTATGPISITLAGFPVTSLSDAAGNDITMSGGGTTFTSGVVTVNPSTIPEPSSLAMTTIALAIGLGYQRSRRRVARTVEGGR